MEEIWKDVAGYEGLYQVSNLGRVKSLERVLPHNIYPGRTRRIKEKILAANLATSSLYPVVGLYDRDTRRVRKTEVHRLVAEAFLGPAEPGWHVHHIDGTRDNNVVTNLTYITHENHNTLHHKGKPNPAKLWPQEVHKIREFLEQGMNQYDIACMFGISQSLVSQIKLGKIHRYT